MITLTPEEEAILRPKYQEYCDRFNRWNWKNGEVASFTDWWRSQADNVKSNRESK